MNEWMNEWMNAWMHECMNAWMHECMNAWMHEWMHECMNACMHACMHACMNEWMNEWMNACMHAWMDGWMNGWMDGWMNEWMNEWRNEVSGSECESVEFLIANQISWKSICLTKIHQREIEIIGSTCILQCFILYAIPTLVYGFLRLSPLLISHRGSGGNITSIIEGPSVRPPKTRSTSSGDSSWYVFVKPSTLHSKYRASWRFWSWKMLLGMVGSKSRKPHWFQLHILLKKWYTAWPRSSQ